MQAVISTVDLNIIPETDVPVEADHPVQDVADDIDTDELEALLVDLKASKKVNKAPPKKRTRKPKAVKAEPDPIEEAQVVVEPVVEPVAEAFLTPEKPKRKYVRKPHAAPEPTTPPVQETVEEPVKRSPHSMIEEMQRAERALRYQMRKNKCNRSYLKHSNFCPIHFELN